MTRLRLTILIILAFILPKPAEGQTTKTPPQNNATTLACRPLSDWINCEEAKDGNIFSVKLINKENNHFLISTKCKTLDFGEFLLRLENTMSHKRTSFTLIIYGKYNRGVLEKQINNDFKDILIAKSREMLTQGEKDKRRLVLFSEDISIVSFTREQDSIASAPVFSVNPIGKIIVVNSSDSVAEDLKNNCLRVWEKTGQIPDYVSSAFLPNEDLKQVVNALNTTPRVRGIIKKDEQPLSPVYWTHPMGAVTAGEFTFPMWHNNFFAPYKNGFRITPEEIINNIWTENQIRIFNAYPVALKEKQLYAFSFNKNEINGLDKDWKGTINKDVDFIRDSSRQIVAHFHRSNSFIDVARVNKLDFSAPITISVWVKPDSMKQFMGLMCFGSSFSLKLRYGYPDFTTATIQDHICPQQLVLNHWHHLTAVYNPGIKVEFFINGKPVFEMPTTGMNPSKRPLMIGNNVWGEQFYGCLDDLQIWNRGLSANEVKTIYQNTLNPHVHLPYFIIIILIVIGFTFYFIIKRRKRRISAFPDHESAQNIIEPTKNSSLFTPHNSVQLFGCFKVISFDGKNVSSTFPPLLKQMICFLILQREKSKNGITSDQLTDTFWPGMPKEKAKENRNTNIKRLRKLLEQLKGFKLIYTNKRWWIEIGTELHVDYIEYNTVLKKINQQIADNAIDTKDIECLLNILKKGNILQLTNTQWIDQFKAQIVDEVTHLFTQLSQSLIIEKNSTLKTAILKIILLFDGLDESALKNLIQLFVKERKHGLAKQAYETFQKNYSHLYDEVFPITYQELVNN